MSEKSQETIERLRSQVEADEDSNGVGEETQVIKPAGENTERSSTREYIILSNWKEVGRVEASHAVEALERLNKGEGEFVAIPSRFFNAFSIKTETKTVTTVTPK